MCYCFLLYYWRTSLPFKIHHSAYKHIQWIQFIVNLDLGAILLQFRFSDFQNAILPAFNFQPLFLITIFLPAFEFKTLFRAFRPEFKYYLYYSLLDISAHSCASYFIFSDECFLIHSTLKIFQRWQFETNLMAHRRYGFQEDTGLWGAPLKILK